MTSPRFLAPALVLAGVLAGLPAPSARADLPPLIPRQRLLRDAENGAPLISPAGDAIAWLAPTNGLLNLWARRLGSTNQARLVSFDPRGTVRNPVWQADGQALLYQQDSDGFGNHHVMQAHLGSGNIRDLTPFTGVQGRLVATSPKVHGEILVALNLRNRRLPDVFRVDVRSGAVRLETENTGDAAAWFADDDLNIRLTQVIYGNGDLALTTRPDSRSTWRPILQWGPDDALGKVVGFGPGGSNVWLVSSVRANTPRLLDVNLTTGAAAIVAQDARYDLSAALTHPVSNRLEAVQFARARTQWQILNTNLLADFEALRRFRDADVDVLSRDVADRIWTVSLTSDSVPVRYALYERAQRRVTPLFSERPVLDGAQLASVKPVSFKARDGLALEGYLTLPPGLEPRRLPTVVLVHGGPWARVVWGFDPETQWLANRGYAVLQVNFRGSTGYGKAHLDAGDKEWGGLILEDLIDARRWAIEQGYTDERRTAIMGTGFGGFAVLATLTRHPTEFAAGVSLAGPPNLLTMIKAVPEASTTLRAVLKRRVGDPATDALRLADQSPVSRSALLKAPLLAAITGHDTQVPAAEMDQFVASVRREGRNVDYLFFASESAVLRDPLNRLRFAAAVEAFLGRHLGGRVEPPAAVEQYENLRR